MISTDALKTLFTEAHTHNHWLNKEVPDDLLQQIYDLAKWGPTSANCSPLRIIFIKSKTMKEKLAPHLAPGNVEKTMNAPVTAIFARDMKFYDHLPQLFPHADAKSWFVGDEELINNTASLNSALQAAYFMLAARAMGIDCGPMSGFDNKGVDAAFLAHTSYESSFLCNLGYGDASKVFPRSPRFSFDEVCTLV